MLELIDARKEPLPVRLQRPSSPRASAIESEAKAIVDEVRLRGDAALLGYRGRIEGGSLTADSLRVDPVEVAAAIAEVRPRITSALESLAARCRETARAQLPESLVHSDQDASQLARPVRRVGICLREGSSGASVIATAVPAQVAGVGAIAVCSPPSSRGEIPAAILAACSVAGVEEVYRIGGAAAVAAMAHGTDMVRPVDMIVGGDGPVAASALRLVRGWVGTGPASDPAELLIVADETTWVPYLAADLVASAGKGAGGTHAVVTTVEGLPTELVPALEAELAARDPSGDIENALIEGGRGVLVRDADQALEIVNAFAPQILMLSVAEPGELLPGVRNAGLILAGQGLPPAALSSLTGIEGVLPAAGTSRWDSSLLPVDFVKTIPVITAADPVLQGLVAEVEAVVEAEGPPAALRALQLRLAR